MKAFRGSLALKLLTAEEARQIALKYIQVSDRRERANRIARTRIILDYLSFRQTRSTLKKNRGFWGKNIPDYIDPVHSSASTLGRLGGLAKSEAKAISSRENGKKGGRPRKDKVEIDSANLDLFVE